MRAIGIALALLACASHGRTVLATQEKVSSVLSNFQGLEEGDHSQSNANDGISRLAALLLALDRPAAGWQTAINAGRLPRFTAGSSRLPARHNDVRLFFQKKEELEEKPKGKSRSRERAPAKRSSAKTASTKRSSAKRGKGKEAPEKDSKPAFSFPSFGRPAPAPEPPPEEPASPFSFFSGKSEPAPAPPPKQAKPAKPFSMFGGGEQEEMSAPSPPVAEQEPLEDKPSPEIDDGTGTLIGAGVAGVAVGSVLADVAVGASGVGLSGEILTDAAVVGGLALGGAAIYAARQPDEAGEVARFVGNTVKDTASAYAELASVKAELAFLEQQQKAQAAIDEKISDVKALPGDIKTKVTNSVTDTVETVKATPRNAVNGVTSQIRTKLSAFQDAAKAEIEDSKRELK